MEWLLAERDDKCAGRSEATSINHALFTTSSSITVRFTHHPTNHCGGFTGDMLHVNHVITDTLSSIVIMYRPTAKSGQMITELSGKSH